MVKRLGVLWVAGAILLGWGGTTLGADCGEPAPAPKYKVGELWTWRDEKGQEWMYTVVQVEGNITQIRWHNGDVASYDKEWIIRKVVRRNGEVLTKQGAGAYTTVGQKVLDFPLQVGRTWEYDYYGQPVTGGIGLVTYYNRQKVVACEEVTTPAGTFSAFKVEIDQTHVGARSSGILYLWYAPQVKHYVRRNYIPSNWWFGGHFLNYELIKFRTFDTYP